MMKHEFEERVGGEISDQNYEIIETVYTWHPAINEVGGKDQIATLYETGGMPLIKSMLEAANIMMDLDKERRQAMRRMEEIRRRIETVASGDLTEEQCRRGAGVMTVRKAAKGSYSRSNQKYNIGFINSDGMEDETQFESVKTLKELSDLFRDFCKRTDSRQIQLHMWRQCDYGKENSE